MAKERRQWFLFSCEECDHAWKQRVVPERELLCPRCFGETSKKRCMGKPGRTNHFRIAYYRNQLIEAYNRDPEHSIDLEVR